MPLFDYQCGRCNSTSEILLINEKPDTYRFMYCPVCRELTVFHYRPGAATFKIKGFSAANGYAGKGDTNDSE